MGKISFSAHLARLAEAAPDRPAITVEDRTLTRAQLEERADTLARHLASLGVKHDNLVTLALPNCVEWFVTAVALWKLGATPQPVSARLPTRELEAIIDLADPPIVIGTDATPSSTRPLFKVIEWLADNPDPAGGEPLPDLVATAWKAPTSGGSTGRPKLIVSGDPALFDTDAPLGLRLKHDGTMVMPGPLYHNAPVVWTVQALLAGNHVIQLVKFDETKTLEAIEAHRADIVYLVPTMMKRILRLPTEQRESYDLSSLETVWHLAEPCPAWLKEAWIDWLGAEKIVELYAGTEAQLATVITGVEWLAHRGSVGRPLTGLVMICDDDGNEVPVNTMGEVWLKSARETPAYRYIGAEARQREGGWESLGDNGWVDDDGYLYLGDRVSDMILTGGANVYPAEVEAALQEHPSIESCAVIGLPDDDLGNRVHAIVQADRSTFDEDGVRAFLTERLVRYKVPRTFELTDEPLRNDAGKVRRSELRAQRL
ncbi:MAG: AMP-binding protein [Acidimicrobiales bacterium]|nr:AMP-binding protein [Acidimicrobiales bacterium]